MKKIGLIGIVAGNRQQCAPAVNEILSQHGNFVLGRMGLPIPAKKRWVITVTVNAPKAKITSITKQLNKIKGVSAKYILA